VLGVRQPGRVDRCRNDKVCPGAECVLERGRRAGELLRDRVRRQAFLLEVLLKLLRRHVDRLERRAVCLRGDELLEHGRRRFGELALLDALRQVVEERLLLLGLERQLLLPAVRDRRRAALKHAAHDGTGGAGLRDARPIVLGRRRGGPDRGGLHRNRLLDRLGDALGRHSGDRAARGATQEGAFDRRRKRPARDALGRVEPEGFHQT
jgi:hypothetical protein